MTLKKSKQDKLIEIAKTFMPDLTNFVTTLKDAFGQAAPSSSWDES